MEVVEYIQELVPLYRDLQIIPDMYQPVDGLTRATNFIQDCIVETQDRGDRLLVSAGDHRPDQLAFGKIIILLAYLLELPKIKKNASEAIYVLLTRVHKTQWGFGFLYDLGLALDGGEIGYQKEKMKELKEEMREVKKMFAPGELGLEVCTWRRGQVTTVVEGQGKSCGVKAGCKEGWVFLKLDGEPFTDALLQEKAAGKKKLRGDIRYPGCDKAT